MTNRQASENLLIQDCFSKLNEPRRISKRNIKFSLQEIIFRTLLALVRGLRPMNPLYALDSTFILNAKSSLKESKNTIEVEGVNVWRNRITGDKSVAKEKKITCLLVDKIRTKESLIQSGLLEPVTIQKVDKK